MVKDESNKLIDDLGLADNTIVQYSTDNGPHYNTWPDAGTTPFRGEKNSNWEGAFRVPCFIKWPGQFPAGVTLNDGAEIVAIRVGDWKATYLENRAHQLDVWREPFIHLRLPLLFNLRRDPFEKSQENSNTYHDWVIDRAFVLVPLQAVASNFLMSLKDFPPSQKPGDWSLDSLEKQIKSMTTAGE
jgi:arylsulfatase A-like enzyme